jgi:8-oxo-dGTP diphosphatase
MNLKSFNIRVYGILINKKNEVLVSDEKRFNREFTKFPGGGVEWGEGIIEALKREFLEELNIEIEIINQFYLTDFFQLSAFHENVQIISVYYIVSTKNEERIIVSKDATFEENKEHHRWIPIKKLRVEDFTFPIDKIVSQKIIQMVA